MNILEEIKKELEKEKNCAQAEALQKFFKTGKGQYGEGDFFLGISIPALREIAKKYQELKLKEIQKLLNSKIHEYRMIALLILTYRYKNKNLDEKEILYFYLDNTKNINNWDLVDLSAPNIVGDFIIRNSDFKHVLYNLAKSGNLWERRIAIISTFAFIKKGEFKETLKISEILLNDKHDLIHKAVGWMLREVGKKDLNALEDFLKKHCKIMPRTMLRYAIEKFEEEKRQDYLKGKI